EVAKRVYEQSIAHLDVALQQTATMIGVLRVTACAVAFNDALKNHFSELEVNELKRISSAKERREINTLMDALLVYVDEISTLRGYAVEAIEATDDFADEIKQGLFVATYLDTPSKLRAAKSNVTTSRRSVELLVGETTRASALAYEDILPLDPKLLREKKVADPNVSLCHGPTRGGTNLSVAAAKVFDHLEHGDTLGPCLARIRR
ncbi:MAG: hypothetical protein O7A62_11695, partial [Alphaproteobacteria bacterium]|nr:hypothetical protein [Alphaproteobacteria bacterium]